LITTATKVRGVNLGGWFVLEQWITPSTFDQWANGSGVVDEYTYFQALGRSEATSRLTQHWNTWVTQAAFQSIAAAGLNHVRIPIRYWALNPLPSDLYIQEQLPILDNAIGWARQAVLKVILDLHGSMFNVIFLPIQPQLTLIQLLILRTVLITQAAMVLLIGNKAMRSAKLWPPSKISQTATPVPPNVVTAIELLNEPMGPDLD
jgi:hypothetical protein